MKNMGALRSFTTLFKNEISQTFVGTSLLAPDVDGLNILDLAISRAEVYHWKYIEFLASQRLSWRKTTLYSRLY